MFLNVTYTNNKQKQQKTDCFSRGLLSDALEQLAGLKRRKLALEMLGSAVQKGLNERLEKDKNDELKEKEQSSSGGHDTATSKKRRRDDDDNDDAKKNDEGKELSGEPESKKIRSDG